MTDHHDHDDPAEADLELASAYLDGEATADERARVERDGDLRRLVDELGEVTARMAVTGPPAGLEHEQVAAALARADEAQLPPAVPVDELARRRAWHRRVPLGAVAAALVVVALVGAATRLDFGEDETDTATADSAEDSAELEAAGGADGATDDAGSGAFEDEAFEGEQREGLGTPPAFDDTDALARHVETEFLATDPLDPGDPPDEASPAPSTTQSSATARSCDPIALTAADTAVVVVVLPAVVAGRPVTAVVLDEADELRLVVVDDETCAVTDDRSL